MRAAIYIRVSTERQTEGTSPSEQRRLLMEHCQKQGWQCSVYDEGAKSGATIVERPEMIHMLNDIQQGEFQVCLALEMTRFSRSDALGEWDVIREACLAGNCKIGTPAQLYDFNVLDDDFVCDLHGIMSKRERGLILRRTLRGKLATVKEGKWIGGRVHYGYMVKDGRLVPDPEHAVIIRDMCRWILEGQTLRPIVCRLHEMGIRSPLGKEWWDIATVSKCLRAETIIGKQSYRGKRIKHVYDIEPIVDMDTWFRVREKLKSNTRGAFRNAKRFYLLRGVLVCGLCGHKYLGAFIREKRFIYYCSHRYHYRDRCPAQPVNGYEIERGVWAEVTAILQRPDNLFVFLNTSQTGAEIDGMMVDVGIGDIDAKLQVQENEKQVVLRLYRKGQIETADVDFQLGEIRAETDRLTRRRAAIMESRQDHARKVNTFAEFRAKLTALSERLETMTVQEKNEVLRTVLDKVVVDYKDGQPVVTLTVAIPALDRPVIDCLANVQIMASQKVETKGEVKC